MSDYEVQRLAPEASRGWEVSINGEDPSKNVDLLDITNERLGTSITYGQRSEGYDGVVIHERNGGGAVTAPYTVSDGELYVGVLREERQTMGGLVWNVPRGMLDLGETHEAGAAREYSEETGQRALKLIELVRELNCNSAVFDTSRPGEGIRIFGVEIDASDLHYDAYTDTFTFPANTHPIGRGSLGERILGTRFLHAEEAVQSPDMFTVAAVGLLYARQQRLNRSQLEMGMTQLDTLTQRDE